ncbi:ECF-type sigma factor [Pseudoxanthomonas sp.]|uniref:ECF-type sigma factor n=1 Tax=Pseudoxanthomonas sp. TaxID=1871049 RepID=UPI0025D67B3B|nr:ECF-type sigma factor [Pseudoxanthomonas sp.]
MAQQPDIDGSPPAGTGMPGALDIATIPPPDPDSVTQLLGEVENGQPEAWNRIYALLYRDLHQIARSQIRQQRRGHVRSPTSLISETWLKLASADFSVENRAHLVALVARAMRFVLLDEVRRALAEKRGEGMDLLPLDESTEPGQSPRLEQLLILDQALNDLAKLDARLAQVVEMRYFGGLSELEIADVLKVTERTVRRDWRKARAFLFSHLGDGELPEPL